MSISIWRISSSQNFQVIFNTESSRKRRAWKCRVNYRRPTDGDLKNNNIPFARFIRRIVHEAVESGTFLQDGDELELVEQIRDGEDMHRPEELRGKYKKGLRRDVNKCSSCIYTRLPSLSFYSWSRCAPGSACADGDSVTIWKTKK